MKTRTKNILNIFKSLSKRLGEDLVYSIAYDNGKLLICISVHKSKRLTYGTDSQTRTVEINGTALDRQINDVLAEVVDYFKTHLKERENEIE
jgi:hypothetical protein